MSELHIQALDLNLLRLFDVLLEERSVTRAGARLGLSQSAVSHALGRLRHSLDDELFTRSGSGMVPTPRAAGLGPPVRAALAQLQAALTPQGFDARTTERRFVLVAGAYACAILVPALAARLAEAAPRAELVIMPAGSDLLEQLDSRRADFVLGGAVATPQRLAQETLLHETLTWVVRAENPLPAGPISLEDLVSVPHVAIAARDRFGFGELGTSSLTLRSSWDDYGALEAELSNRGLPRRIGVTVPDSYSALGVVRRSDMAALIPRRLAMLTTQTGILRLIEPPYRSPRVDLSLLYLRERLSEPAMAWMRDQLKVLAEGV